MSAPSRILAIETSGPQGSVALLDSRELRGEIVLEGGSRHEVGLGPACRQLLDACGWTARDLDAVAVGLGPGSFTGTRIGVTFAKTLAFALDLGIVGLPGLLSLAVDGAGDADCVAVMQRAHPSRVYGAAYQLGGGFPTAIRPVDLWAPEDLLSGLPPGTPVVGSAVAAHRELAVSLGLCAVSEELAVRAATLGMLARSHLEGGGAFADAMTLLPLYLQAPAAER